MCRIVASILAPLFAWQTNGVYLSVEGLYNIYQKYRSPKKTSPNNQAITAKTPKITVKDSLNKGQITVNV